MFCVGKITVHSWLTEIWNLAQLILLSFVRVPLIVTADVMVVAVMDAFLIVVDKKKRYLSSHVNTNCS